MPLWYNSQAPTANGVERSPLTFTSDRLFVAAMGAHPGRWRRSVAVVTLALCLAPAWAAAQGSPPGPIVTDRPTDSASPVLVPTKTLQVETGYTFNSLDTEPTKTETHQLPELLARFGISDRVEARLFAAGWSLEESSVDSDSGFKDVTLGAKIALAEERGRRPQLSLLADVSLPLGAAGFTDDEVIPRVLLLATHSLTDRLALTYNIGPSLVTLETDGGTETDVKLGYAVALGAAVGSSVTLFGELFGAFVFAPDEVDSHTFQVGATVLLTRTLQVDVRGGWGAVGDAPDWLFGAGLAFRIPR